MNYILINEEVRKQILDMFNGQLVHPVELLYFSKNDACESCDDAQRLMEELSSLSDKLHLSIFNLDENPDEARQYNIDLAPTYVIAGNDSGNLLDYGIRVSGIPSGYEFGSFIHSILLVSRRDSGLQPEIRKELSSISDPINLKVFVTPTWPYCPQAVVLAHQLAMENPLIQAEMISANEFHDLAMRYNVRGVPQTTINDGKGVVLGSVPAEYLLQEIQRSL